MKGFRQFILRGNVLDLAVAVVIGAAFGKVITALVTDLITPLIKPGPQPDFSAWKIGPFLIGDFINAVFSFLMIAAIVYFLIVLPVNSLVNRMKRGEVPPDPTTKKCPECLSDIPMQARRCAHCTSVIA